MAFNIINNRQRQAVCRRRNIRCLAGIDGDNRSSVARSDDFACAAAVRAEYSNETRHRLVAYSIIRQ